jgi:hypothetical protein
MNCKIVKQKFEIGRLYLHVRVAILFKILPAKNLQLHRLELNFHNAEREG